MKKLNLYGGLAFSALFLYTGYYLVANVSESSDAYLHLSGRANHIYLLLIALLNVVCGLPAAPVAEGKMTAAARVLLLVGGVCACVGFFTETGAAIEARMMMPSAVGLSFFAVALLYVDSLLARRK